MEVTKNGFVKDVPKEKLEGKGKFIGFLDADWKLVEEPKEEKAVKPKEKRILEKRLNNGRKINSGTGRKIK